MRSRLARAWRAARGYRVALPPRRECGLRARKSRACTSRARHSTSSRSGRMGSPRSGRLAGAFLAAVVTPPDGPCFEVERTPEDAAARAGSGTVRVETPAPSDMVQERPPVVRDARDVTLHFEQAEQSGCVALGDLREVTDREQGQAGGRLERAQDCGALHRGLRGRGWVWHGRFPTTRAPRPWACVLQARERVPCGRVGF